MAIQPIQSAFSRYKFALPLLDEQQRAFLEGREPFRYQDRGDNVSALARRGERWWHFAQRFYRDISTNAGLLYWVLCDYQIPPVVDPTLLIQPGTLIVGPSPDVVLGEVLGFAVDVFQ